VVIWYIYFSPFGTLCQEKSGNPESNHQYHFYAEGSSFLYHNGHSGRKGKKPVKEFCEKNAAEPVLYSAIKKNIVAISGNLLFLRTFINNGLGRKKQKEKTRELQTERNFFWKVLNS
jgi:hypothetical protein